MSKRMFAYLFFLIVSSLFSELSTNLGYAQVLDKNSILARYDFWDNKDWDWYTENIPFFDCPDEDITLTYYYRWELITKHPTYAVPNTGYIFTEFIDRPFWSGAYGAISCPAGHQLYEARWLRSPRIGRDYAKYWLKTPGAQPRNYSTWLADSIWKLNQVHPNHAFTSELLDDLIANYEAWEQKHFDKDIGLFWQTGHDDGMEFNINSRQTQDNLRGAPSYRPSFNAYLWADAIAISKIADQSVRPKIALLYREKAKSLKQKMIERLWDDKRQFFFPVFKNDEHKNGYIVKALTKTYESGQFAGSPYGRELIGYVPWQFEMLDQDVFDVAWKKLMDRDGFYADFGPTTVERNDPMFVLQKTCCWWSGQSWPYATTQTLKAMANLIQRGTDVLTATDYVDLLRIYARSHRKNGSPYLAEALHPDTGSFEGHDNYNHSEHYFHSAFCDLVITGLVGFRTRDDDCLELIPLTPSTWEYFALDGISYRGKEVTVLWDKFGNRYGYGKGMRVLVDGKTVFDSENLQAVRVNSVFTENPISTQETSDSHSHDLINFAVNNDGTYYPRTTSSYASSESPLMKINDGNYWYMQHPPNRWTADGSTNQSDWIEMDFGVPRLINEIKLYLLDDGQGTAIRLPNAIALEFYQGGEWIKFEDENDQLKRLVSHRPLSIKLENLTATKLRITLHHAASTKSGLTEIEAWGPAILPLSVVPPPVGNQAYNDGITRFPQASASHSDRFGGNALNAIDGKISFNPMPLNRWTSYESPNTSDWLQIDFIEPKQISRAELYLYDDQGGVQPPQEFWIEFWNGDSWQRVINESHQPTKPTGGTNNTIRFNAISTEKIRVVFVHQDQSRSGVTEIELWRE